jgi:hypothetical protein
MNVLDPIQDRDHFPRDLRAETEIIKNDQEEADRDHNSSLIIAIRIM